MTPKDTVGAKHGIYDAVQEKREIFQDVIAGTERIREKRTKYIPQFPRETTASYDLRCSTATLFNLTRKTRDVMTGLVFQGPITLSDDVAPSIVPLWENIDNQGTHGDVFCRRVFEDSFEGYAAILVDAPGNPAQSLEEERNLGLRPYWIGYTADQIWNWRYRVNPTSKKRELAMIVLRETSLEEAGRFLSKQVVHFRVFNLDMFGIVTWELYREQKNGEHDQNPQYILEQEGILEKATEIPIGIVRELGEPPPFQDIALKNIEHIQTYSDYKSIIHKTCVPFAVRKGYQKGEGTQEVTISGDSLLDVAADGDFFFAEVQGKSIELVRQSLVDMREDISLMGLSILADKTAKVDLTATEALLNNISETAELRVLARNMQDCIEACLGFTAEYLGLEKVQGGSVVLGTAWNRAEEEAAAAEIETEVV